MSPVEHNPLHAFVCREVELLHFLGMDQNSIAAAVGISHGLLSMMLNGRRKATLKRVFAITQLASERKDTAIRSSVTHIQETVTLPPSTQRNHVLRQWNNFQTEILRLQHRATHAMRDFTEREITTIRDGMHTVQVIVEAFTAKEKLDRSEIKEAQKEAIALSQGLQELAKYTRIIEHCTDELTWLEDQIQQRERTTICQSKRPAARSRVDSP